MQCWTSTWRWPHTDLAVSCGGPCACSTCSAHVCSVKHAHGVTSNSQLKCCGAEVKVAPFTEQIYELINILPPACGRVWLPRLRLNALTWQHVQPHMRDGFSFRTISDNFRCRKLKDDIFFIPQKPLGPLFPPRPGKICLPFEMLNCSTFSGDDFVAASSVFMAYVKCYWFMQSAQVCGVHLYDDDDNDIKNNSDKHNSEFRWVI